MEQKVQEQFDFAKAKARLEEIAALVEKPDTSLDDVARLVVESKELLTKCREYLRKVRSVIDGTTTAEDSH